MDTQEFHLPVTNDERIACFISNRVASLDDDRYIYRSYGRRKTGRPVRYVVHTTKTEYFSLTAFTDDEAIMKANKRIAKTCQED